MDTAGSWKRGDQQGFEDAKKHPVLIGVLHGICLAIAFSLPVSWYWRIAAFFAMQFAMGFVRMVLWPIIDGRRQEAEDAAAAWRIIRQGEANLAAQHAAMLASLQEAAEEGLRRTAELEDIAAHGTPEERQWVADLNANLFVTPEEAQRMRDAPSPSARIERYRQACAAYDAAHSSRHEC